MAETHQDSAINQHEDPAPTKDTGSSSPRHEAPGLADAVNKLLHTVYARLKSGWESRRPCSRMLYLVVFLLLTASAVIFLQYGVYEDPTYDDPDAVYWATRAQESIAGQVTFFVSQMWLAQRNIFLVNFLILGLVYLIILLIINRFWLATGAFSLLMVVYGVANLIKVALRKEPILASDFSFLTAGNGGQLLSFIPDGTKPLVRNAVIVVICAVLACVALQFIDKRGKFIASHWRHPLRNRKTLQANATRIIALVLSVSTLFSFTWTISVNGSWAYRLALRFGDTQALWNTLEDAQDNGVPLAFLRLAHTDVMDKPDDYNATTMRELAQRYSASARRINAGRTANLTDSTVIMVLSESFSDPNRVPGISLTQDPMPNIRAIKDATTSGLMLSPGYGGGTANIEYQSLTGLNMALFDDSLQSPYQELVPHQKKAFTFNQLWNDAYGKSGSIAFHPYLKNMYLRDSNYRKFGFQYLRTLDSTPEIKHQDKIDYSPYVSDAAAYQNVLDAVNRETHPQFIQLATMQNHLPYGDWYSDNQFKQEDLSRFDSEEQLSIAVGAKGVSLSDQATADFLNQLNQLDKPVTVIFYGDHLPSIYTTAAQDSANALQMHETDYFIWSNQASSSANAKLGPSSAYTTSNFFMAQASEHMGAKVSPYLALLTELHEAVPAVERLVLGGSGFGDGSVTYLDDSGNVVRRKHMSAEAKQLLHDYTLVQYDLTKGRDYLLDEDFTKLPQ